MLLRGRWRCKCRMNWIVTIEFSASTAGASSTKTRLSATLNSVRPSLKTLNSRQMEVRSVDRHCDADITPFAEKFSVNSIYLIVLNSVHSINLNSAPSACHHTQSHSHGCQYTRAMASPRLICSVAAPQILTFAFPCEYCVSVFQWTSNLVWTWFWALLLSSICRIALLRAPLPARRWQAFDSQTL